MVKLSTFPQPTEGIRFQQHNTAAYLNNANLGKGTLYIAESQLSWIGSAGNGFSVEYPHISLHAVSRDLNAFPEECLFLMLDIAIGDQQDNIEIDDSESDITTELRFVPEDRGLLDAMFHALSACQALHPDPEDSFSDEDFYEDADEDIPVDETNSRLANLCIGGNNAFGLVGARRAEVVADCIADCTAGGIAERMAENTVAAGDMVAAEDRVYNEVVGSMGGLPPAAVAAAAPAEAGIQSSSEHTRTWSYHKDQADNCSDTGWFDDVEN